MSDDRYERIYRAMCRVMHPVIAAVEAHHRLIEIAADHPRQQPAAAGDSGGSPAAATAPVKGRP